ncbi:MAG: metallophosphatase family protein [Actinomycetota bacterium]|nr:metallophosphatase family protein [Actinomycetota bacterium]
MRIAVLSDIHGNLLALDAVMSDLDAQSVDEVWCGGDLGWGGPWASECIARVRKEGWPTVRGNTDIWITGDPQSIDDPAKRELFEAIARAHAIGEDDAHWLLNLPLGYSGAGSILLVHATPETPFDAPLPEEPAARFAPFAGKAALVVYAHVHRAFVRRLADGTLVANTGAVGFPMDDESASYLIIDAQGPECSLIHRRVRFDRRGGLAQAKELGDPIESWFRQGLGE